MSQETTAAKPQLRVAHMGQKVNALGDVSALCFVKPRAIDLKRATWTLREQTVSCPKCRRLLEERRRATG